MKGLPDDLSMYINMGRSPKLENLKVTLQQIEPKYVTLALKSDKSIKTPRVATVQQSPTTTAGRRPSLKDTYNPQNISQTPSQNDPSKKLRTYTLPDGTSIQMTRNCTKCDAPHFTFEHDYLVNKSKRKASNLTIEGYPIIQSSYPTLTPEMMGNLFAVDEDTPPVSSGSESTSSKRSKN